MGRILSKAAQDAVADSKCLEEARKNNRLYEKAPPEMIYCVYLLKATSLFGNTRCLTCKRWYFVGKTSLRENTEEYGLDDIIVVCESSNGILPSAQHLNS